MAEITIKVPNYIKAIVGKISKPIYIEAIKTIAEKKLTQKQKRLKVLQEKVAQFESRYSTNYNEFSKNISDTKKEHDDWIEWTYLQKTVNELISNTGKLELLLGK